MMTSAATGRIQSPVQFASFENTRMGAYRALAQRVVIISCKMGHHQFVGEPSERRVARLLQEAETVIWQAHGSTTHVISRLERAGTMPSGQLIFF